MDPTYPLYPIFAFVCMVLVMIPLPWHLQAWNTGTCMFMIWTGVVCLIQFINSIIWRGNAINVAPVYCDISTRIVMGAGVALPACSFCIQRCLYRITNANLATFSREQKRRNLIIDLCVCLGFPIFIMALAYIVQGHRFSIYEDIGCTFGIYNIWPAYPIYFVWPLVFGLMSLVYCVLTLRSFSARRSRFQTSQRYVRLMLLSTTDVAFTIGFSTWVIYSDAKFVNPYISWADTHSYFSVIHTFPSIIWRNEHDTSVAVEFSRWNIVMCAIVFIAFFSFAEETRGNYKIAFGTLAKRTGLSNISFSSTFMGSSSKDTELGVGKAWTQSTSVGSNGTMGSPCSTKDAHELFKLPSFHPMASVPPDTTIQAPCGEEFSDTLDIV
ncbi:STE3-domain-containing protein [Rickenella mellea]|uniref:STE3-domain-containing protein n=1 Tax=Rickenella mellea TaxID=50990 RepID=A0A4Y7PW78_9AGAM|nr:STE3-domain-containing protein [Rickenella mellea]